MDPITNTEKKLKHIAGFLGLLQGLSWTGMSIAYLFVYYDQYNLSSINSFMDEVEEYIYAFYISDRQIGFVNQKLTSNIFNGFIWTYFVLDVIWMISSITLFTKSQRQTSMFLQLWSLVTCLICLLDLILTILLGVDYHYCSNIVPKYENIDVQIEVESICSNGILPVLTIAAKGFILWIVNLIFVVVSVKTVIRLKKQPKMKQMGSPLFQNSYVPSPYTQPQFQSQSQPQSQFQPQPRFQPQSPLHVQTQSQPRQFLDHPQFQQYPPTPSSQSLADSPRMQQMGQFNQYQQPFVLDPPPQRRNRF